MMRACRCLVAVVLLWISSPVFAIYPPGDLSAFAVTVCANQYDVLTVHYNPNNGSGVWQGQGSLTVVCYGSGSHDFAVEPPPAACVNGTEYGFTGFEFWANPKNTDQIVATGDSVAASALVAAFYDADAAQLCISGCVATFYPDADHVAGIYWETLQPVNGNYSFRAYGTAKGNGATSCEPGTAGTLAQTRLTAKTGVVASSGSGTSTGTGTGGASACVEGDTRAACATLSTPAAEAVPASSFGLNYSVENIFSGGSCPNDVLWQANSINRTLKIWDWHMTCQYMVDYIKPIVLLIGAWLSFVILMGGSPGRSEEA